AFVDYDREKFSSDSVYSLKAELRFDKIYLFFSFKKSTSRFRFMQNREKQNSMAVIRLIAIKQKAENI
ncbi:MAG: hypothetical protein ACK481_03355, partial [Candidatus Melainabacteria bacterium]